MNLVFLFVDSFYIPSSLLLRLLLRLRLLLKSISSNSPSRTPQRPRINYTLHLSILFQDSRSALLLFAFGTAAVAAAAAVCNFITRRATQAFFFFFFFFSFFFLVALHINVVHAEIDIQNPPPSLLLSPSTSLCCSPTHTFCLHASVALSVC